MRTAKRCGERSPHPWRGRARRDVVFQPRKVERSALFDAVEGRVLIYVYTVTGRHAEAEALFERLLALRNDVGVLSEEFDPRSGHMLGDSPQALSHMALINTARLLSLARSQIDESSKGERPAAAEAMP